ncbi:MAG: T9SS type A sorting domain-containing protein [Saprospiraceae bacterium]|nr:T9SS type A sorting domain-containing protein [Saprospiraceae bacterium]
MIYKILPTIDLCIKRSAIVLFMLSSFHLLAYANPLALTCPTNVPITLDICESEYEMNWDDIVWSSDVPIVSAIFEPSQGTLLDGGLHNAIISVVDINNQPSSCSFTIEVFEMVHSLICKDTVTISLSNNCTPEFTYETLAVGMPQLCEDQIEIKVIDQFGVTVLSGTSVFIGVDMLNKPYTYSVTDFGTPFNFTCGGVLNIIGPTFFVLNCPDDQVVFCNEDLNSTMIGMPDPVSCFNDSQINFNQFDQTSSFVCPDERTFEITRTWVGTNPLGETTNCSHKIIGKRLSLSQILFPPDYDDVDEPAILCQNGLDPSVTADTSLTGYPTVAGIPIENEACDFHVSYIDSLFEICGASYEIRRYWEVIDSCKLETRIHKQTIVIRDYSSPVFEVIDTVYANISPGCSKMVPVPPVTIVDECSGFDVRISTPFDTIYTDGGSIEILFIPGVYFCDYTVTDHCGNESTEPFILMVDIGPLLKCPEDRSISTNFYADNVHADFMAGDTSALDFFGKGINYSNCIIPFSQSAVLTLDSCGTGEIVRTFTSTDPSVNIMCEQLIEINHVSDFVVEFPPDITIECDGNQPFDAGEPVVHFGDWEEMNVSNSDQKFDIVPGYCFRIVRTWTVTNDCVLSDDGNHIIEDSEHELSLSYADCDLGGVDTCDVYTFKDGLTVSNFPNSTPDGIIVWTQVIRVNDDINPLINCQDTVEICIDDNACNTDFILSEPEFEDCTEIDQINIVTDIPSFNENTFAAFDVPPGNYSIEYSAFDECGNGGVCESMIFVKDCVSPNLLCGTGLLVQVTQNGFVEVLASDLNEGVIDNCIGNLNFSFSSNPLDTMRTFDCDHLGQQLVEYWVMDSAGNQDSCTTFIMIQDDFNFCIDEEDEYGGKIKTFNDDGVGLVNVEFSDGIINNMVTTEDNGNYIGWFPPPSNNMIITPTKDINLLNGVTTFDLVILQKHIVFVDRFDDPYKWIAADANNSGTVTISDAVAIKKAILFIDNEFPNNSSWRFVDAKYIFPNPDNPWQEVFPESISNQPFTYDNDFIGIKIGDLNRNANPLDLIESEDRNFSDVLNIRTQNLEFEAGETIMVPFQIEDFNLAGYQFSLKFDKKILEFEHIVAGFANENDFGKKYLNEGVLTTSWNGTLEYSDNTAFALVFKTKRVGELRNLIKINSEYTIAEGYSKELELMDINLVFEAENEAQKEFVLFQNRPNPFSNQTIINFYLPENALIDFEVTNVAGQSILTKNQVFEKGINTIEISNDDMPFEGVYFYKMRVDQQIETRRIVKILQN